MKNNVVLVLMAVLVLTSCKTQKKATVDNSRNSLDWSGIYAGKEKDDYIVLQLYADGKYSLERNRAAGKADVSKGEFVWDSKGRSIKVAGVNYRVGEGQLQILNKEGAVIQSLTKVQNTLVEKYWKLTELFGQPVTTAEGQREAFIIFRSFENRYNGNGGCNLFSGSYELLEHGRIKLSPAMSTQMACVNGMDTESKLHEVLGKADTYIVTGDNLVLTKARMAPLARFEAVYLQ